jgi:DNA repair protein RecO (recombination protein O)
MEWTDDGIVLSTRKHGETSAILALMTRDHGRHLGLVRGGTSKRVRGVLQPGNRLHVRWRARLSEHLGTYTCEMTGAAAAGLLRDRRRLAALSAACAVAESTLPEREPHPKVFEDLARLLAGLADEAWPAAYVRWEINLLAELGFGLDLSVCAATGANDQLVYVSPKSGRAVSLAAGEPYRTTLLPLPGFLLDGGPAGGPSEIADGLRLTGYFLERNVYRLLDRGLPPARARLADRLKP